MGDGLTSLAIMRAASAVRRHHPTQLVVAFQQGPGDLADGTRVEAIGGGGRVAVAFEIDRLDPDRRAG